MPQFRYIAPLALVAALGCGCFPRSRPQGIKGEARRREMVAARQHYLPTGDFREAADLLGRALSPELLARDWVRIRGRRGVSPRLALDRWGRATSVSFVFGRISPGEQVDIDKGWERFASRFGQARVVRLKGAEWPWFVGTVPRIGVAEVVISPYSCPTVGRCVDAQDLRNVFRVYPNVQSLRVHGLCADWHIAGTIQSDAPRLRRLDVTLTGHADMRWKHGKITPVQLNQLRVRSLSAWPYARGYGRATWIEGVWAAESFSAKKVHLEAEYPFFEGYLCHQAAPWNVRSLHLRAFVFGRTTVGCLRRFTGLHSIQLTGRGWARASEKFADDMARVVRSNSRLRLLSLAPSIWLGLGLQAAGLLRKVVLLNARAPAKRVDPRQLCGGLASLRPIAYADRDPAWLDGTGCCREYMGPIVQPLYASLKAGAERVSRCSSVVVGYFSDKRWREPEREKWAVRILRGLAHRRWRGVMVVPSFRWAELGRDIEARWACGKPRAQRPCLVVGSDGLWTALRLVDLGNRAWTR